MQHSINETTMVDRKEPIDQKTIADGRSPIEEQNSVNEKTIDEKNSIVSSSAPSPFLNHQLLHTCPQHTLSDLLPSLCHRIQCIHQSSILRHNTRIDPVSVQSLYAPLPHTDSIRLLHIHPSLRKDSQIHVSLHLARLSPTFSGPLSSTPPVYEALSYVWGHANPSTERSIVCNGIPDIRVGQNLHDALTRLRKRNRKRFIWVDKLCINQQDEVERGQQVRQMGNIYRTASRVVVWLGRDGDDEARIAFGSIKALAERRAREKNIKKEGSGTCCGSSVLKRFKRDAIPPPSSAAWKTVHSLFECQWFSRMWVLQEIVLAQQATFHWGRKAAIDWEHLAKAVKIIQFNVALHALVDSRGFQNASIMEYFRDKELGLNKGPSGYPFVHLLDWSRSFDVSNPKDKVYGLLGFGGGAGSAEDTQKTEEKRNSVFIEPNYNLTTSEIFISSVLKILAQDRNLDILSFVAHDGFVLQRHVVNSHSSGSEREEPYPQSLPSWVPDWTRKEIEHPILGFGEGNGFKAGIGRAMEMVDSENLGALCLKGVMVDTIAHVLAPMDYEPINSAAFTDSLHSLLKECYNLLLQKLDPAKRISPLTLATTLTGGRGEGSNLINPSEQYQHVIDFLSLLDSVDPSLAASLWKDTPHESFIHDLHIKRKIDTHSSIERARAYLWRCQCYRRLFWTAGGRLGIGPMQCKEGDNVVVWWGGQVPFVVREGMSEGGGDSSGWWRFVGESYVTGLMEGEAVREVEGEEGHWSERVFELR